MKPRKMKREAGGSLRVLGYVRVSTEKQVASGAGLDAQREAIERECAVRGYDLLEIVEEHNGISAKSLERPGIRRALEELAAGRADALIVAKLDRLSRSLRDFINTMDRARKEGWALIALDQGVDTTTPQGKAMTQMSAVFAELERELIGARTKAAMAAKKRAGGKRPGPDRILPADVVRRIVIARERGMSLAAIAELLNRDGVPTARGGAGWWPNTVAHVLRSVETEKAYKALAKKAAR